MQARIAVLAGDGIGAEVTAEAVRALEKVATRFGHRFAFESALLGGAAIDATGEPLPSATLTLAKQADAILLGAVGALLLNYFVLLNNKRFNKLNIAFEKISKHHQKVWSVMILACVIASCGFLMVIAQVA